MEKTPCPVCSTGTLSLHAKDEYRCSHCGASLVIEARVCPTCGETVDHQTEECPICGEPLTPFSQVISRHQPQSPPLRQRQTRAQAEGIQSAEEIASNERMGRLKDVDRRRLAQARLKAIVQQERDRRILKITAIGSVSFFLLLILIGLVVTFT